MGDPADTCVNGGMYYRAAGTHQAKICINGQWTALGVPRVTTLPSSPANGDEVYYAPNGTNGEVWHIRYDANITDSYKWVVLGGSSKYGEALGTGSRTSGTDYGNLDAGGTGPTVSIPRAGIYDVTVGASMWSSVTNGYAYMSFSAPGIAVNDNNAVMQLGPSLNAHRRHTFTTRATLTGSGTLTAQYKSTGGGVATFEGRRVYVTPIRLAQ